MSVRQIRTLAVTTRDQHGACVAGSVQPLQRGDHGADIGPLAVAEPGHTIDFSDELLRCGRPRKRRSASSMAVRSNPSSSPHGQRSQGIGAVAEPGISSSSTANKGCSPRHRYYRRRANNTEHLVVLRFAQREIPRITGALHRGNKGSSALYTPTPAPRRMRALASCVLVDIGIASM